MRLAVLFSVVFLSACAALQPSPPAPPAPRPVKIGLALGGGAARGFAHIGVIKTLEAHGIVPDIIAGTSAGAVVGALRAAGNDGFALQKLASQLDKTQISDWSIPNRGLLKGEALQDFINDTIGQRPIQSLKIPFGAVATNLATGESILFRTGNTGLAVRASSAVPGLFQPVEISGREYVDGGLSSRIPVRSARLMGADVVIAVDISASPTSQPTNNTLGIFLQTFVIMGRNLAHYEIREADVVIQPRVGDVGAAEFQARHDAILEGERAARAALPKIREAIKKASDK